MIMFITISHKIRRKGERKWWSCGKVLVLFPTLPLSDFHSSFFSTWIGLKNGSTFWKRYFMIMTIIVIYQQCLWFFLGILLLKSLSFGSLWWLLPSILGILFPLCRYIPLYMPPCLLPSIVALLFPDMDPLSICKSVPTTKFCSVFRLLFSCTY